MHFSKQNCFKTKLNHFGKLHIKIIYISGKPLKRWIEWCHFYQYSLHRSRAIVLQRHCQIVCVRVTVDVPISDTPGKFMEPILKLRWALRYAGGVISCIQKVAQRTVTWKTRSQSSGAGVPESNLWKTRSLKYGKHGVWRKNMENTESKIWKTRSLI